VKLAAPITTQEIPGLIRKLKILLQVHNISELQITGYKWDEQINETFLEIMKRIFIKYINPFA